MKPEPHAPPAENETLNQYLTFRLGDDGYAIAIREVREILEFTALTEVPLMPAFIRGIINLRGSVVPVIDLQVRFGRAATEIRHRTCVVIVELANAQDHPHVGVLVDSVNEVITAEPSMLEEKPTFGAQLRDDFVAGILNINGQFIITLDMQKVLSIDEMAALVALEAANTTLQSLQQTGSSTPDSSA